jgi:hypothetical protein
MWRFKERLTRGNSDGVELLVFRERVSAVFADIFNVFGLLGLVLMTCHVFLQFGAFGENGAAHAAALPNPKIVISFHILSEEFEKLAEEYSA